MPTTEQSEVTRIRVPAGTVPVLEADVLEPVADLLDEKPRASAGHCAQAAWACLRPMADGAELRFRLGYSSHLAAAAWLMLRLHDLLERPIYSLPEGIVGKQDVLARIGNELDRALRRAGMEVER